MKQRSSKGLVLVLLGIVLLIVIAPLFLRPGAAFGGSDDAGSEMVAEVTGEAYEPWFPPVLETALGGELPGEIESLIFCVQTGIGVGIIAFALGRWVERKKWMDQMKGDGEKPSGSGMNLTP